VSPSPLRKLFYATLSILLVLVTIEALPRVGGWLVLRATGSAGAVPHGDLRILCTGDSYTYGMGTAPNLYSWPRQLERLIRERNPELSVAVRNAGVPGRSSGEILNELAQQLDETRPQIVCVLVGLNNYWKFDRPLRDTPSWLDPLRSDLRRLRAYRVLHWMLTQILPSSWMQGASRLPDASSTPPSREQTLAERVARDARGGGAAGGAPERRAGRAMEQNRGGESGMIQGLRGPRDFGDAVRDKLYRAVNEQLREDFEVMADQIEATGAELVLLTYPEGRSPTETVKIEVGARRDLVVADLRPAFSEAKQRVGRAALISPDGSHPSGAGYSVVAACAYAAVREAGMRLGPPVALAPPPESSPRTPDYESPESRAELDRWIRYGRRHADIRTSMDYALMLADAGLIDEAIGSMESFHQKVEAHNLASRVLAGLYRRAGRLQDERRHCERMIAVDPAFDFYRKRIAELDSLEASGR